MTVDSEPAGGTTTGATCYRHPQRETGLRCTRCGQPACYECLRPAPVGSHCLQCLKDGQKTMRLVDAPWQGRGAGGPGLALIIAVCVGVFGLQFFQDLDPRFAMIGAKVADGEVYRLVTSMFLHFGVFHLLMNMLAVWIFGQEVERREGSVRTVAVFLVTGIVGGAAAYLFHPPFAQVAGASGGVFGLFGVALVRTIKAGQPAQQLWGLLLINLFIGIAVPGISLAAHGGGLAAGVLNAGASTLPRRARPALLSAAVLVALVAASAWVVTSLDPGLLS
jgi:membrane associated rhomboid family serine protease